MSNTHTPIPISTAKTQTWQQQLANAFTDIDALGNYLSISPAALNLPTQTINFPLKVPQSYADRIEKGNPNDPLLKQILPEQTELTEAPGYLSDPVGDLEASANNGIIHKYHGRALLITTGACAINCRYCFRRHFPYQQQQLSKHRIQNALSYIENHPELSEIILSGGDPLALSDERIDHLLQQLKDFTHIKRIRIHTRLPVVLPARITRQLMQTLINSGKQIIMVLHANHPQELNNEVADTCRLIKQYPVTLLNQSVLLKDINDSAEALCNLSEALFDIGVLPYYLHLLDKAKGTQHFEVSESEAGQLISQVQNRLPGYLVPKLVKEISGAPCKITVASTVMQS